MLNYENLIALSNETLREEIRYNYYHARCHGNLDNIKQNFLWDELIGKNSKQRTYSKLLILDQISYFYNAQSPKVNFGVRSQS